MASVVSSTLAKPFFLQKDLGDDQPIYYTAADLTRYTRAIMRRSGILGEGDFLVTQADNVGLRVKVNTGYANVGGKYIATLEEDQTLDFSTWTGGGTHKVYLTVYNALESGTGYDAKVEIVQDLGAGAAPPADAAAWLQLATVTVGASQSLVQNADIDNTVRHGGMAGEYVYFDDYGLLDSGIVPNGATDGTIDARAIYSNGAVRLAGSIKRSTPDLPAFSDGMTLGTMHSNLRPNRQKYLIGACSGAGGAGVAWRLQIDRDGTMTARIPSGQSPTVLMFDGISYELD